MRSVVKVALRFVILVLICNHIEAASQPTPYTFGNSELLLNKGWVYHDGINDDWLLNDFDDSDWSAINPTLDFKKLGFFNYDKPLTLRLRFSIDQLPLDSIYICIRQSVASKIYLNGILIANYGTFSDDLDQVKAIDPLNRPLKVGIKNNGQYVLTVQAAFQRLAYFNPHSAFRFPLFTGRLATESMAFDFFLSRTNTFTNQGLIRVGIFLVLFIIHFIGFLFYPAYRIQLWFSLASLCWCTQAYALTGDYLTNEMRLRIWLPNILHFADLISIVFVFISVRYFLKHISRAQTLTVYTLLIVGLFFDQIADLIGPPAAIISLFIPSTFVWISYSHFKYKIVEAKFIFFGALSAGISFFIFLILVIIVETSKIPTPFLAMSIFFNITALSMPISISMAISQNFRFINLDLLKRMDENDKLAAEKESILINQRSVLEEEVKARTVELQTSLQNLKATQSQLIQSEKMASLGELTAGIAHEIQNPLNFVNNFSDVNKELIKELKSEIQKNNLEEVKLIANDIESNEEKIVYHGKRADGIVKSMLQHSRTSAGQKELTDINALCDEFVRLSYHGLRAKDKSFNAKFETDFDPLLPKVNVVAQDIGRVILNLINNAFYAVSEKAKAATDYQPIVRVITKQDKGTLFISIQDNGIGVPGKIREKIFQPFFTSKPAGQGTGLGLSLSYDIITKGHGGTISVESDEINGTEFIINIPV